MLAAAIAMFVINRPRMDAVALLVIVAMPLTGIITMNEALAGFSDSTIVLIAALFVIGEGLVRTGVARRLGDWLDAKAGSSETRLLVLLMAGGGRPRLADELDRGGRDLHPGRAAHLAEPRHGAQPADDAVELRRPDQRHADAGRHRAEPGRQRRTDPPGRRGLRLLQLHAVRAAAAGPRHRLHAVRAARCSAEHRPPPAAAAPAHACATGSSEYQLADREQRVCVDGRSPLVGKRLEELSLRDPSGVQPAGDRARQPVRAPRCCARRAHDACCEAGDVLLVDVLALPDEMRGAARELRPRVAAARRRRGLLQRPVAGDRHGRGRSCPPNRSWSARPCCKRGFRSAYGLTVIGAAARPQGAGGNGLAEREAEASATRCCWSASGPTSGSCSSDRRHGRAEHAGRTGRGAAGGEPRAARAGCAWRWSSR